MGLTKTPILAKKTLAEIASESDEYSETELQMQIQIANKPKQLLIQKENKFYPNRIPQKNSLTIIFPKIFFLLFCRWSRNFGTRIPSKLQQKLSHQDFTSGQQP